MILPLLLLGLQITGRLGDPPPPIQTAPPARTQREDDVVVTGYRLRPDIRTKAVPPAAGSLQTTRQGYEWSEVLAKCAARNRLSGLKWLRGTVDGEFHTVKQLVAQDHLRRIYTTCSENPEWLNRTTLPPGIARTGSAAYDPGPDFAGGNFNVPDVAPLGRNVIDRGAFTVQVIKRYAPDLSLTREQTTDPAVQARFNLREVPRNRFRLPADYRYFEVAVCIVRMEPRLAVQLTMTDGPARFGDIQAALIDRARVCVGGAGKVTVDPTEFRLYVADAVYRWAVAARGVDSLIPPDTITAER